MSKAQQEQAMTSLFIDKWEQASRKLAELAEALPAEKFESPPMTGIRTPGQVLRHVAFWNQYVADSLRGKEPDDTSNELPLAGYSTKVSVLEALRQGSQDVAAMLRQKQNSLDLKTAELVVTFIEHTSEHYGQLVVYARLLGMVPPASRT
jgi:uncharacterized damage-inducible protein DinB